MTLLLLAGTAEARRVAGGLAAQGTRAVASVAGVTRSPGALPLPTRVGGFGGAAGFVDYLTAQQITAVLDATHPFAARITDRTARICAGLAIPYLHLLRPEWVAEPGDLWTVIAAEAEAATYVPPGATVFLATGRQTLDRFANLTGRRVLCRQIDPPTAAFPFKGGAFILGRPPFSVEHEAKLFADLGVDWLVVKNAGGTESRTKLTAARQLGLPVLMLSRPPLPDAARVETVAAALAWVRAL